MQVKVLLSNWQQVPQQAVLGDRRRYTYTNLLVQRLPSIPREPTKSVVVYGLLWCPYLPFHNRQRLLLQRFFDHRPPMASGRQRLLLQRFARSSSAQGLRKPLPVLPQGSGHGDNVSPLAVPECRSRSACLLHVTAAGGVFPTEHGTWFIMKKRPKTKDSDTVFTRETGTPHMTLFTPHYLTLYR